MSDEEDITQDSIGCLLVESARVLRKVFDRRMESLGVTRSQWQVLVHLCHHEGISQSELAERLEIEQPSLVRLLHRLEKSGLIERRVDEHDRRIKRVYLGNGSATLIEAIEVERDALREEFLSGLNKKERELVVTLLGRVKMNLMSIQENGR